MVPHRDPQVGRDQVSNRTMGILKVIEILASSPNSWEEAAANAVSEATKTVRGIKSVYIQEQSATVEDGKIKEYRCNCKITFSVGG